MVRSAPVLIADDEPTITRILERTFRHQGVVVCTAADGARALELARATHPSLVFADWHMPELDGLRLVEAIVRDAPSTRCILMTGFPEPGLYEAATNAGAACLLIKPFPPAAALAVLAPSAAARATVVSCAVGCPAGVEAHDRDLPPPVRAWMTQVVDAAGVLVRRLCRAFPGLGQDRATNALHDAILAFCWRGATDALPPPAAVYRMAWRHARDIVASDRARSRREIQWSEAVLQPPAAPAEDTANAARSARLYVSVLAALPDDHCPIVFSLWITGVRDTHSYAAALDLLHLPVGQQRLAVKRLKDRFEKIMRRSTAIRELVVLPVD